MMCDSPQAVAVDEDGDLILGRKRRRTNDRGRRSDEYVLTVQHGITSSLRSVGLRIWKAALLLADFVLHKIFTSSEFDGAAVIEVGSGTGDGSMSNLLVDRESYCLALSAHYISITYKLSSSYMFANAVQDTYGIQVKSRRLRKPPCYSSQIVIYSDDLTDLFFDAVRKLMSRGAKKVLYLTLEKRYNFSFDDLDVMANGYKHFRSLFTVQDEFGDPDDGAFKPGFRWAQQIEDLAEVPQY